MNTKSSQTPKKLKNTSYNSFYEANIILKSDNISGKENSQEFSQKKKRTG